MSKANSNTGREARVEIIVGVFVALILTALGIFTIVVSGASLFGGGTSVIEVVLPDAMGLRRNDPVIARGTSVGTVASIVPLVIAAFPFVARLVESSLREVNPNIIEAAQSMGASPMQIIVKVMIPESVPSLLSNFTIAITTILGYSAMSGIIGGGGLGKIAINYGYYRYKYLVMLMAVILLIALVQIFQSVGTKLATKTDKRLKKR